MIAVGTGDSIELRARRDRNAAFDLASGAHILGVRADGFQRDPGDIRVCLGVRIQRAYSVANGGVRHAHPSVEPGATAETADYRDGNGAHDRGTGHRTGEREV